MDISAEAILEARGAYRRIQRYRRASSPLFILVLFAFPLVLGSNLIPGLHRDIHLGQSWGLFAGLVFWICLHTLQYRSLKKQSDEARERLDSLRSQYGTEIDVVAKEKSPLFAWRD